MDNEEVYLNRSRTRKVADVSTEMAKVAYEDVVELLEGAEAKAYWALSSNYDALEKLSNVLYEQETLTGEEVAELIESCNPTKFVAPYVSGFSWSADGELVWPDKDANGSGSSANGNGATGGSGSKPSWWSSKNSYEPRKDIADLLGEYK
jgi:hypothetical protein